MQIELPSYIKPVFAPVIRPGTHTLDGAGESFEAAALCQATATLDQTDSLAQAMKTAQTPSDHLQPLTNSPTPDMNINTVMSDPNQPSGRAWLETQELVSKTDAMQITWDDKYTACDSDMAWDADSAAHSAGGVAHASPVLPCDPDEPILESLPLIISHAEVVQQEDGQSCGADSPSAAHATGPHSLPAVSATKVRTPTLLASHRHTAVQQHAALLRQCYAGLPFR